MASQIQIVRDVACRFCAEFVEHPYLCYTEHGLHALLFACLFTVLGDEERFFTWHGHGVCVIQKEYPTAHSLGKSKRQNWDLAVIKTPPESLAAGKQSAYDYLALAAALEVGLNEPEEHLRENIRRLDHKKANVEQGLALHLYRLAKPGRLVSGRDWSYSSSRILSVERVAGILTGEGEAEIVVDQEVEILYAVAGETGEHEPGVWLIRRGVTTRLV